MKTVVVVAVVAGSRHVQVVLKALESLVLHQEILFLLFFLKTGEACFLILKLLRAPLDRLPPSSN